jgi:hypothetical protein
VRSFGFILKVGIEDSIVDAPVEILRFYRSGAFTIDSSAPTLRIH